MDSEGMPPPRSSLVIVPRASTSPAVAPEMLETVTRKISVGSTAVSPLIVTENVLLVWPAGILWPARLLAT